MILPSHNHRQMQNKTSTLETVAASIGLRINREKTKAMRINTNNIEPVVLKDGALEDVSEFTYLGSVVDTSGGTDKDIRVRIGKARTAFRPVGRNFQRGVRRHASRVAHLAAGVLGALSDPQKPRGIWSKILQSSNFKALHSNFRKVLFFKIQILHQLGL